METVPPSTLEKCPHIDVSQSKERAIEKSHNLMLDGHLYFKSIWLLSECKLTSLKDGDAVLLSSEFTYHTEL